MKHHFHVHTLDTGEGINLHNLTEAIHEQLQLGQWQSVMLVELDGPRVRQVSIQITG